MKDQVSKCLEKPIVFTINLALYAFEKHCPYHLAKCKVYVALTKKVPKQYHQEA